MLDATNITETQGLSSDAAMKAIAQQKDTTAAQRSENSQKLSDDRQTEAAKKPAAYVSDRSNFLSRDGSAVDVTTEHHKKTHRKEETNARFSEDLKVQFERFITEHVKQLTDPTNDRVNRLLTLDFFKDDKELIDKVTNERHQIDSAKLSVYLNTDEGWSITEKIWEKMTAMKLNAIGLEAAINPQGKRVTRMDDHTVNLHVDQGSLNQIFGERLGHWLGERALDTGRRPHGDWRDRVSKGGFIAANVGGGALTSGLGALIGSVFGQPGIGALAGVGLQAAGEGVIHLVRSGVVIDTNQSVDAFKVISQIPGAAEYMKTVMNIDIDNLVVDPTTNKIVENIAGHTFIGTSMDQVKNEIYQGLFARQEFYQSLGVPPEAIDALPEQFLLDDNLKAAEQTSNRLDKRIFELMDINNPTFRTTYDTLDKRLKLFYEIRQKVIMEQFEVLTQKTMENVKDTKTITLIREKAANRQENGSEITKRQEVHKKKIDKLTQEKTDLTAKEKRDGKDKDGKDITKTVTQEYEEARTALTVAQKEYETKYPSDFSANLSVEQAILNAEDLLSAKSTNPNSFEQRVKDLTARKKVRNAADKLVVQAEVQRRIAEKNSQQTGKKGEDTSWADKEYDKAEKLVDAEFKREEAELAAEEAKLVTKLEKLKEIRDKIKTAREQLVEIEDVIIGRAKEDFAVLDKDFTDLTVTGGLNDIELRNLTVDELMVLVNSRKTGTFGWDKSENEKAENRVKLINAITEAKSRFSEQFYVAKAGNDAAMAIITGLGISEINLRTLTRDQLIAELIINKGWKANKKNLGTLDKAIEGAKRRAVTRHNVYINTRISNIDNQIELENEQKKKINFENDIDILTTCGDVMERQGSVFEAAYQLESNLGIYTDASAIDPTDKTFSQSEINSGYSKAYWKIAGMVFGHEDKSDRGRYADKIIKTLPPADLAELINKRLSEIAFAASSGITIPAATNPDFKDFNKTIANLKLGIEKGDIKGFDTRRLFADIINYLRDQALGR